MVNEWLMNYSVLLNPLTPLSGLHLISLYIIPPGSNIKSHKNKGNDHKLKKLLIVKKILLVSILGNV